MLKLLDMPEICYAWNIFKEIRLIQFIDQQKVAKKVATGQN